MSALLILFEETQNLFAVVVIIWMFEQSLARAGARDINFHDLPDPRIRSIGHHDDPVRKQDGFIHIMRHTRGCNLCALPHFHEHFLKLPARQAIKHPERFIQ